MNGLGITMFEAITFALVGTCQNIRSGSVVDVIIINAPTSSKIESEEHYPEMPQAKKGSE